ncbi:U8 snoRNA-decapping enzyme [Merluccius polli]|uniref:U8 snoRNA-decapping enzyme n=1 Tax=Merluccius polli TaxID=89951 RepID=A0AA47M7K7_MERPO|nr:U8 snoRNA-decapping enzyme [Merluccius polli]
MASGHLTRAEALAHKGVRHACHVMLYCDAQALLFGTISIRHIVLMQMRFDGLLGFPGGLVNPLEESLEAGLSRELMEEMGMAPPVSEEDHVASCYAPPTSSSSSSSSTPPLITHFYVKKVEEEQIRALEKAGPSTAIDHGLEVLGVVRVPLYSMTDGGGLPSFLSNGFAGNARAQLLDALTRFHLVAPDDLCQALATCTQILARTAAALGDALALAEDKQQHSS